MTMHAGTLLLTAVLLLATGIGVIVTRKVVRSDGQRLLRQRTGEVATVLDTAISQLSVGLQTLGQVAKVTHDNPAAFATTAAAGTTTAGVSDVLLRPSGAGFVVILASGGEFRPGQLVTGERAATLRAALRSGVEVPTPVLGAGRDRRFGLALGPPAAPAGEVVYRESLLGPLGPPREAATAPFHELKVALYAGRTATPSQALLSTATSLPLTGAVHTQDLLIGHTSLLLTVSTVGPVVGTLAADAPWLLGAFGLLVSALTGFVLEQTSRRRDAALVLYATQRSQAEALQRSLLPELTGMAGVDTASRYLPGAAEQRIGGDWFDFFRLGPGDDDRMAVVIGDVMGHDMGAAAAMAQVRAALRAYGCVSNDPGSVLERLQHLVEVLDIAPLVTVFYGVLDPRRPDGSRVLRYSNAGHLPPLLRDGGGVTRLDGAMSTIVGAPHDGGRPVERAVVAAGSSLVLYTDGLVETVGGDLSLAIDELASSLSQQPVAASAEDLAALLEGRTSPPLRDDVAILVLRIPLGVPRSAPAAAGGAPAIPERLELECDHGAARQARRWIGERLAGWDADRVDVAQLLVSELTTNAVLHAQTSITLSAEVAPGRARVRVADRSPAMPVIKRYGNDAETGRGFHLVATMADAWGVEVLADGGKAVWFDLGRAPAPAPAPVWVPGAGSGAAGHPSEGAPTWTGPDLWADVRGWDDDPAFLDLPAAGEALAGGSSLHVRILAVPTRVYLLAAAHNDALLRELSLLAAGTDSGTAGPDPGTAGPGATDTGVGATDTGAGADTASGSGRGAQAVDALLAAAIRDHFAPTTDPLRHQVDDAVGAGRQTVDLEVLLSERGRAALVALAEHLDQADRRCEDGAFLTLEAPEQVRRFRHWVVQEVAAQAAGHPPAPWPYGP